jgi:hypothetical protein
MSISMTMSMPGVHELDHSHEQENAEQQDHEH